MNDRDTARLDSWKEIADYIGRDVRTAIRWEKERGMPVRRIPGPLGHGVFALRPEIDAWLTGGLHQASDPPSVAVLPFLNASEPDQEYLSDGITESVINALARIPRVRVMAWTTVRRFRGSQADPREVGRHLKVRAILAGRLLRRNSFWQVSAELIDPADGAQLWGKQYALPAIDLQNLPTQITGDVLSGLGIQLGAHEQRRLIPARFSHFEAFDLLLQARHQFNQVNASSLQQAIGLLQRAIHIEPDYADAYAEMASCYTFLGIGYGDLPAKEILGKADAAARKALELDGALGSAHAALAAASPFRGFDWPFIEKELRRAIELSPGLSYAHTYYGTILSALGRFDEAVEELSWAAEIDPLSPFAVGDFAFHLAMAGRLEEAESQIHKAIQLMPQHRLPFLYVRAVIYELRGLHAQAIQSLEAGLADGFGHTVPLGVLGYIYARNQQPDQARAVLSRLEDLAAHRPVSHFSMAIVHAGLGDIEAALAALEQAYGERTPFLYFLNTYPWFDGLRQQSRFAELLRKVGLPELRRQI